MTDINLLHDREAGDEAKEAAEKKKQQSKIVELTNPPKEPQQDATSKPGGVMSFFKSLFGGSHRSADTDVRPKILHQERVSPPVEPKERFAPPQSPEPAGVEDIFAAPAVLPPAPKPPLQRRVPPPPAPEPAVPKTPPIRPTGPVTAMDAAPPPAPQPPLDDQKVTATEAGGGSGFLGVNLVPEEMLSGSGKQNRLAILGLIALMTAVVVGLFYVGLSIFQSRIVSETEEKLQEIAEFDRQIQALTADKRAAIDFYANTQQVVGLLDSHIYWTNLLKAVETHTVQSVVIRSLSADQAGHLTLSMTGRDYRSVAQQLLAFEAADDLVQTVSITAASTASKGDETGGSVDFSATITLTPGVLNRTSVGIPPALDENQPSAASGSGVAETTTQP